MSKKALFAVIAVVILAVGGGVAYMLTSSDSDDNKNQTNTQSTTQTKAEQPTTTEASLASFLTSQDSKTCTYSTTIDGRETKGTVYFANQKLRMDYTSTSSDGKTQGGSMIVTNGTQYLWDTSSKQGVKFAFTSDSASTQNNNQTNSVDVNKQYSFLCKSWDTDESKFTPPSDVTFQDFSSIQQQIGQ
jgi:hypothetical protein